jgi:hypothetical protein
MNLKNEIFSIKLEVKPVDDDRIKQIMADLGMPNSTE